jgi:hypothetical protein
MNALTRTAVFTAALLLCGLAFAAGKSAATQAQQQYQRERAQCLRGESHQDKATCLKEAGAAYQEARRGGLATQESQLPGNATQRCNAQPEADRADCVKRLTGAGSTEGSVKGGGVIRQTETKTQ